jgi:hypothetical protein
MNIEVFKDCKTVEEAVEAAQAARCRRLELYVDLHFDGVRMKALAAHSKANQNKFANQISVAITSRRGLPEKLSRRLEQVLGLPFGWLEQEYPESELLRSKARGKRLARKLRTHKFSSRFTHSNYLEIISGAASGERGLSKSLYMRAVGHLVRLPRG